MLPVQGCERNGSESWVYFAYVRPATLVALLSARGRTVRFFIVVVVPVMSAKMRTRAQLSRWSAKLIIVALGGQLSAAVKWLAPTPANARDRAVGARSFHCYGAEF